MIRLLFFIWIIQYKQWSESTSYMRFVLFSFTKPSHDKCEAVIKKHTAFKKVNRNWLSVVRLADLNANPYSVKD